MGTKGTIVVVEDETIIAMDLQRILMELDYTVPDLASSGEEAIQKVEAIRPDLVFMDIALQGKLDGIQAATEIRTRFGIPVVFLTSYADESTVSRAKIVEPLGYIIKPFDVKELSTTVEVGLYKARMERKLRESEAWLSTVLTNIGDAVVATDRSGKVRFMNGVAESLTGTKREKAAGLPVKEVVKIRIEGDPTGFKDPLLSISAKKIETSNMVLVKSNGEQIPVEDQCSPIQGIDGKLDGVVWVFKDVTEKRQAQVFVQEKRKMEALVVMATGVAHEVRNPLSVIQFKVSDIKSEILEPKPAVEAIQKSVEKIEAMTVRITKIIRDMLAFARGNADRTVEPTPVQTLVDQAVEVESEKLKQVGVELRLPATIPASCKIECNSGQLVQVLVNLMNNAADAIFELPEKWIKIEVLDQAESIEIAVTDSGKGIPLEIRSKMLEPFFTTKAVGKGTGLGLSIIKNILEAHHGTILIDTQSPNTRFVVKLPKPDKKVNG